MILEGITEASNSILRHFCIVSNEVIYREIRVDLNVYSIIIL